MHRTDPYQLPKNDTLSFWKLKLYFIDMIYIQKPLLDYQRTPNKEATDAQAPEIAAHDKFQILNMSTKPCGKYNVMPTYCGKGKM